MALFSRQERAETMSASRILAIVLVVISHFLILRAERSALLLSSKSIFYDVNPPEPIAVDTTSVARTKSGLPNSGSPGSMNMPPDSQLHYTNIPSVGLTDENTAVALVSMGSGSKTSLIAERCIRTIRASGNFTGYILLFTDDHGYETKKENLSFDPKVIVIRGREEDMAPKRADGSQIQYWGKGIMIFKRFKTLVLRYLDYDSRFDAIRYALYLDVDNIVTNRLAPLFDDYAVKMSETLSRENSTDFSYFSFWRDPGMKMEYWQGGQIMYDRYRSTGCVDAWRDQMDTVWGPQDQPLLMNVYNNITHYGCKVFELPDHQQYFSLLTAPVLMGKTNPVPTLVHITTAKAKKFLDSDIQGQFIRKAMHVSNEKEMMTDRISWFDVSKPCNARGGDPKPRRDRKKKKKTIDEERAAETATAQDP